MKCMKVVKWVIAVVTQENVNRSFFVKTLHGYHLKRWVLISIGIIYFLPKSDLGAKGQLHQNPTITIVQLLIRIKI